MEADQANCTGTEILARIQGAIGSTSRSAGEPIGSREED
jgi:hypothetical protein